MHMPVVLGDAQAQSHLLVLKPLTSDAPRTGAGRGAAAFQIPGLMFEIVDVSSVNALCGLKQSAVEQYVWQLRNDLESLQMGTDLLKSKQTNAEQRARVRSIIDDKLKSMAWTLARVESDVKASIQSIARDGYPLEILSRVHAVIADLQAAASGRAVRIVLDAPRFLNLVIAQPEEFDKLLRGILETLVNDAADDSEIRVRIWLETDKLTLQFNNAGFGLPNDDLQRFLSGQGHAISEEFRILHECMGGLLAWGGQLQASSEVGRGFHFELTLPTVI
jgi:K+-sensing histidine kinase KdpD